MVRQIWSNYEGPKTIRYGEDARWIRPRVIQLSKTMKESWPSIEEIHGPLDPEDTWRKIIISLTGKSKERSAHLSGEWSYLVVTLSRAREAKPYFRFRDMESREDSSQNTQDAKVRNEFSNKAVITTSGYICGR
jgi:hypothetical protein